MALNIDQLDHIAFKCEDFHPDTEEEMGPVWTVDKDGNRQPYDHETITYQDGRTEEVTAWFYRSGAKTIAMKYGVRLEDA